MSEEIFELKSLSSQIVTYNSGACATKVVYILVRRTDLKIVKNAKTRPFQERCTITHACAQTHASF